LPTGEQREDVGHCFVTPTMLLGESTRLNML
jgi:hypothetical protein